MVPTDYATVSKALTTDFEVWSGRFLNRDRFLCPSLIAEYLMDRYSVEENEAYQWAFRWIDEPRNAHHKDPFSF